MDERDLDLNTALDGFEFAPIQTSLDGIVAGAIVVVKIVHEDGSISVQGRWDGVTWLERPTMLRALLQAEEYDNAHPRRD